MLNDSKLIITDMPPKADKVNHQTALGGFFYVPKETCSRLEACQSERITFIKGSYSFDKSFFLTNELYHKDVSLFMFSMGNTCIGILHLILTVLGKMLSFLAKS